MKKILIVLLTFLILLYFVFVYFTKETVVDDSKFVIKDLPEKFKKSVYFSDYHLEDKFVIYVDFSQPMTNRRIWVVDNGKVIANSFTSHGAGSMSSRFRAPNKFSNIKESKQSSLGIYRIIGVRNMNPPKTDHSCSCDQYLSSKSCHHYAKKFPLKGLDQSNSNSLNRGIVIHTSWYVAENNCKGNSNGCFVVSPEVFEILQSKNMYFLKKCYLVAIK
jgi:hypothetical protein